MSAGLHRVALAALAGSVIALALPGLASAQPPKDRAGVLERFDAAQKLFDQRQYDDALPVFQKVYADTQSPNARLMVARCYLALGQTAAGYDELAATVREAAQKAQSEPKYARTRDAAAAELAALEPRIGKIVVAVVDPGVRVTLTAPAASGGTRESKLAGAKLGVPLAVMPGVIVVSATRADGATAKREERVGAGETKTITVLFGDAAPVASPPPQPVLAPRPQAVVEAPVVAPAPSSSRSGGQVRVAGFVTAAIGVAGFAVFGGTYAVAQSDYNKVKSTCGDVRCTNPSVESTIDSGKTFQLVSNVALPVATVLTLAGAGMIVFGGPKATTPRSSASLSVAVRPAGVGLNLGF